MNELEETVTRVKGMMNASVEAIRQEEVEARDRAQETCPECGGPTEVNEVVFSVVAGEPDTTAEEVCLDAECGWRG